VSRNPHLRFVTPQLPSLTDQPPEGSSWIHEVKHDGYRTLLLVERGAARAHTRNGHNWSDRYPGIIAVARKLAVKILQASDPARNCATGRRTTREIAHPREKRDLACGLIEELMAVAAEIHEA
jgi:bifunctional non-homologous end joining protein LigD